MNFTDLIQLATSGQSTAAAQEPNQMASILSMIIPLGLMIVIFYFFLIRPEKKRSKTMKDMLSNIQVADEIVTTGGIVGRVISVKEDTVLLETGSDRTKLRILKSAIAENRTIHDDVPQA